MREEEKNNSVGSEKIAANTSNSNNTNSNATTTNGFPLNNNIAQEEINARENLTIEFKKIYSAENNKSLGDILEMHNDACLLLGQGQGEFNITPKSGSRRGSGTNTPGTYVVN